MPKSNRPITERPTVEEESVGNGSERHGTHRPHDEALPGKGGSKGGLNRASEGGGAAQEGGRPRRHEQERDRGDQGGGV
jgi:hypothetical protein